MKIYCTNFVPKVAVFTNFCQGLSQAVAFFFFSRQFYDFAFSSKFLLFQPRSPSKKSTLALNFWLFHWKKVKNSTTCKKLEIGGILME